MNNQPKTPGAMVQIAHEQLRDLVAGYCGPSALGDLYALADAPAEQTTVFCETCSDHGAVGNILNAEPCPDCNVLTPAVGGSIAERIRAATIVDSGQEGVNIAEGRFGRAMAALCLQLDGETPAVGGEQEVLAIIESALRRSFTLGQIYWQQADSDSTCQQNKSDQTMENQAHHIVMVTDSVRKLFQAQPATTKVVLPERMSVPDADCPERVNAQGWNSCLDKIAKLNP